MGAQGQPPAPTLEQPQPARLTPEQLRQLVAPIALYPDALSEQHCGWRQIICLPGPQAKPEYPPRNWARR